MSALPAIAPGASRRSFRPSARFAFALLASLLSHGALLAGHALWHLPPPRPKVLEVDLRPVEMPPAEPLLKNTIEAEPAEEKPAPPPPKPEPAAPQTKPVKHLANPIAAAQRKIAQHVYYPPEAVAAGLEGEVRLLLTLDASGRIVDADVAASSGHAVLDKAAVRAAWAMGNLEGADKRELILPVVFRLR